MNRSINTLIFLFLISNIALSNKSNSSYSFQLQVMCFQQNTPGEDEEPPDDPIITSPIPPDTIIVIPIETIIPIDSIERKCNFDYFENSIDIL